KRWRFLPPASRNRSSRQSFGGRTPRRLEDRADEFEHEYRDEPGSRACHHERGVLGNRLLQPFRQGRRGRPVILPGYRDGSGRGREAPQQPKHLTHHGEHDEQRGATETGGEQLLVRNGTHVKLGSVHVRVCLKTPSVAAEQSTFVY